MLALIAGRGQLPGAVMAAQPQPPLVCALDGMAPDHIAVDVWIRLETLGSVIADLRARGVTRLCMCGAIDRPRVDPSRIDAATQPLVPRILQALALGDDGALRIVIAVFEEAGITVIGAHEAAPDLLPPVGVLEGPAPDPQVVTLGRAALADMGARDLGQACLVLDGAVIAREDAHGTDALIAKAPRGAVLVKGPKPDQDRRADLPTIGPDTVAAAQVAGVSAIVVLAQGVMMLDQAAVRAACRAAGIALWVA